MRKVQVSEFIEVEVDADYVHINDELNGDVSLDGVDMQSIFALWVKAGGLDEQPGAGSSDDNPQGLQSEDAD